MAPINPWLATLIENELEHIITWKSIVKPDPDAKEGIGSRLSDDGSNFRSVVGPSSLDSESTIQLLEKPGSNARAKVPISDGDVSILATLSDAAWDAYDQGLEEGEEARKGDLVLCKKITIVCTTYGPSEERIKLRIEDLELTGNFRKVIGSPAPLLQRDSVLTSLKEIEDLRLKQFQEVEAPQDDEAENEVAIKQEEIESADEEEAPIDDDQANANHGDLPALASDAIRSTALAPQTLHETPQRPSNFRTQTTPRNRTPPTMLSTTSGAQIESQLPQEITQTQQPPQNRNPLRRTRGGFLMGREGIEPTRGDNLTGPQAPTLHARQALSPVEPPRNKLLDVISKLPGQALRQSSPEPSAPVSAQVLIEDTVVETPTKGKRTKESSITQESTPAPRKRYRIPRDQKSLLDSPSSWIPSVPGQQFPHPNVPIGLLKAWNARANSGRPKPPSQSSPIPTLEQSSGVKSIEVVHPEAQATAAAEPDSDSEASSMSEDEPLTDWSVSPSRSQMLPPDSSAAHSSARTSRPSSRNPAMSDSEHVSMPQADDTYAEISNKGNIVASGSEQLHSPNLDKTISSQVRTEKPLTIHSSRENSARPPNQTTRQPARDTVRPDFGRATRMPSSSMRSPELRAYPQGTPVADHRSTTQPDDAAAYSGGLPRQKAAPQASMSLQSTSNDSKRAKPMYDNFHTPVHPSMQQALGQRYSSLSPRGDVLMPNSTLPPSGAPTGPRNPTGSWHNSSSYKTRTSAASQERKPTGDFYRPSPSGSIDRSSPTNRQPMDRQQAGASRTPASTFEMESAVPRPMPRSKYHENRSQFYRDAQRRQWLDLNLPTDVTDNVSITTLLHSYQETYNLDPVTEEDFVQLILELRPEITNTSDNSLDGAGTEPESILALQAAEPQAIDPSDGHNAIKDRDRRLETHANDVFKEFLSGWKSIRPGGAWSREAAVTRPQRRTLNVLSWGFGE